MAGDKFKHILLASVLAGSIFGAGCSHRPEGVLSDEEAASLLADLHIAEAYGTLEGNHDAVGITENDSVRKVLRQSIMKTHGVSEAQLDTTLGWYGHNLDKYGEMYERVLENIDEKQKMLAEKRNSAEDSKPGLWPYDNLLRISGSEKMPALVTFDVDGKKIPKGGRLEWEAKTINAREVVEIYMAAEYPDGSVGYLQRTFSGDGRHNVALQTDSSQSVRRVYGYLRVKQTQPLLLDSIRLVTTPFSETNYYETHSTKTWRPKR